MKVKKYKYISNFFYRKKISIPKFISLNELNLNVVSLHYVQNNPTYSINVFGLNYTDVSRQT